MSSSKNITDAKITISGKSGCGNTTVSRILSEKLKIRFINFTFRSLAQEKGLDLKKILELAAKDDFWDREVDTRQVELAREKGGCVLGSRLAIWMLPEADIKIFLEASPETRAKRIQAREGGSLEDILKFTSERDRQDQERYKRIYKIDNDDHSFADLVIDVNTTGVEEISERIITELKRKLSSS